jgi:hypothetical protein
MSRFMTVALHNGASVNAEVWQHVKRPTRFKTFNPLNAELNPICYSLALLGAHHYLHVSRIRVNSRNLEGVILNLAAFEIQRSLTL